MRKLYSYSRDGAKFLVLACCLILAQAFFELLLPAFSARLVDTGIQNYGIERAAPDVVTPADLELARTGMTDAEKSLTDSSYEPDGRLLRKKPLDAAVSDRLDEAFCLSEWTLLRLAQTLPDSPRLGAALESSSAADLSDVDFDALAALLPRLRNLPESDWERARAKSELLSKDLRARTGAAFAREFYADAGVDAASLQTDYLAREGGLMLGAALAAAVCALLGARFAATSAATLAGDLRTAVFEKTSRLSPAEFDRFGEASLLSRTTSDITLAQSFVVSAVRIVFFALCMSVGGVAMAFAEDVSLAWTVALAALAACAIILLIFSLTRPRYRIVQKMIDRLNLLGREIMEGEPVIRAFGRRKREEERYDEANDRLASTQLGINRILIFLSPSFTLIVNLVSLLIVWIGAGAVLRKNLQVGDIIAYMQYAVAVLASVAMIAGMFVIVPRVSVAAGRVLEVLGAEPLAAGETRPASPGGEAFAADAVTFAYPGCEAAALADVSVRVEPGKVTALTGPVGSGKTTLLRLLARFYDPASGRTRMGAEDLRDMPVDFVREAVAFDEERDAPGLSAGESARARAERLLSRDARLYLLDGCFRGASPGAAAALLSRLREKAASSAVLIADSRVARVQDADHIYVLENGRIVGSGTHEELLRSCDLYRRMADAES